MRKSPLVIVGIGGSGTRVFARLAEASGRHMGAIQNDSNDALALFQLASRWCEPIHRAWQGGGELPNRAQFETELAASVARHRQGAPPDAPWGWKQPRSIHLLPALEAAYSGDLLVLHVIRDGRDVALGKPIHLQLTGSYSVAEELQGEPVAVQLAHLWASTNRLAADFGERLLGERYLRVSLEDLCADTDRICARIFTFIGGEVPWGRLREIIRPQSSVGRWRQADPGRLARITSAAAESLARFGYTA